MFIGWKIAEFFFHIIHSQGSTDCQVRRPTGPTWSENFKFFWSGHRLSKSCSSWSGSVPVWDSQIFKLFLVLVQTGPWFSNFVVSPVRRFCDRCTGVFVDWLVRAYVLVDGKLQCFFFKLCLGQSEISNCVGPSPVRLFIITRIFTVMTVVDENDRHPSSNGRYLKTPPK